MADESEPEALVDHTVSFRISISLRLINCLILI